MKKIIITALAISFAGFLTGCNEDKPATDSQRAQEINDGVAKSIPAPSLDMPTKGEHKY